MLNETIQAFLSDTLGSRCSENAIFAVETLRLNPLVVCPQNQQRPATKETLNKAILAFSAHAAAKM
jgi:hypothetical protein